jgi:uncharacterized protein GlcG (DUF336 family)
MKTVSHSVMRAVIEATAAGDAVRAAVVHASTLGLRVNVAVVDSGGNLVAFLRMAGAPLHSVEIAIDKAYTAASFGLPTHQWSEVLQGHSAAVREGLVRRPRFVAFGGGLPMIEAGQRIGGIGVSGGSEEQDQMIAMAGLAALGLTQT